MSQIFLHSSRSLFSYLHHIAIRLFLLESHFLVECIGCHPFRVAGQVDAIDIHPGGFFKEMFHQFPSQSFASHLRGYHYRFYGCVRTERLVVYAQASASDNPAAFSCYIQMAVAICKQSLQGLSCEDNVAGEFLHQDGEV